MRHKKLYNLGFICWFVCLLVCFFPAGLVLRSGRIEQPGVTERSPSTAWVTEWQKKHSTEECKAVHMLKSDPNSVFPIATSHLSFYHQVISCIITDSSLEDEASYSPAIEKPRNGIETISWYSIKPWCTQFCVKVWSLEKRDFTTRKYTEKEGQIGQK